MSIEQNGFYEVMPSTKNVRYDSEENKNEAAPFLEKALSLFVLSDKASEFLNHALDRYPGAEVIWNIDLVFHPDKTTFIFVPVLTNIPNLSKKDQKKSESKKSDKALKIVFAEKLLGLKNVNIATINNGLSQIETAHRETLDKIPLGDVLCEYNLKVFCHVEKGEGSSPKRSEAKSLKKNVDKTPSRISNVLILSAVVTVSALVGGAIAYNKGYLKFGSAETTSKFSGDSLFENVSSMVEVANRSMENQDVESMVDISLQYIDWQKRTGQENPLLEDFLLQVEVIGFSYLKRRIEVVNAPKLTDRKEVESLNKFFDRYIQVVLKVNPERAINLYKDFNEDAADVDNYLDCQTNPDASRIMSVYEKFLSLHGRSKVSPHKMVEFEMTYQQIESLKASGLCTTRIRKMEELLALFSSSVVEAFIKSPRYSSFVNSKPGSLKYKQLLPLLKDDLNGLWPLIQRGDGQYNPELVSLQELFRKNGL